MLFVAEASRSLQKISELYDQGGFAAAGKNSSEFDNLRRGGSDSLRCRSYARDVAGRQLANVYALGFASQAKPYEVELCVAEVAHCSPELYRITGRSQPTSRGLSGDGRHTGRCQRAQGHAGAPALTDTPAYRVAALQAAAVPRVMHSARPWRGQLRSEFSDANRPRRELFRRITGSALQALLVDQEATV